MARVVQHVREIAVALPAGAQLPSVRELMDRLAVGPGTVREAFAALASEGVIEAHPGRGTFVAPRARARGAAPPGDFGWQSVALGPARTDADALGELVALAPPGAIPLSTGYLPDELQATRELSAAMSRAVTRPGIWDRIPLEGLEPLRAWFARELGSGFSAREVMICPGSQSAIATAFHGLAVPGSAVLVEAPTYIGAMAAARAAGLRLVPVAADSHGVRPDLLADALRSSGGRVFYSQPTYANPSGAVLSERRRRDVLAAITEARAFMVEDDWARDLHFGDKPAPPPVASHDADGHVVYIRSLTKPAAPGLRIAALCARGAALARLRSTRNAGDFFVAGPLQEAALQLVSSPAWPRHLRMMRTALRERRDALAAAVRNRLGADALPLVPDGGLHLWVRLPDGVSDAEVAARATRANVVVGAGRSWFAAEPPGSFLRLTFAAAPPEALRRGVEILAEVVDAGRRF